MYIKIIMSARRFWHFTLKASPLIRGKGHYRVYNVVFRQFYGMQLLLFSLIKILFELVIFLFLKMNKNTAIPVACESPCMHRDILLSERPGCIGCGRCVRMWYACMCLIASCVGHVANSQSRSRDAEIFLRVTWRIIYVSSTSHN